MNKEGETVLGFLINNSRWIKLTDQQKLRLKKYANQVLGGDAAKADAKLSKPSEMPAEIKVAGSVGASTIESNLLEQLDDISHSFRSLVDTLTALEERCSAAEDEGSEGAAHCDESKGPGNSRDAAGTANMAPGNAAPAGDLMDFSHSPVGAQQEQSADKLPVLTQLTRNWPCVAAAILGTFPKTDGPSQVDGPDVCMPNAPKAHQGRSAASPSGIVPGDSCNLDAFVFELLTHANEAVLVSFVETVIQEMNKYAAELTLESVLQSQEHGPCSQRKIAFAVGLKFVRSVVRQMAVHLSRTGLSYVDLRSRIVTGSATSSPRLSQNGNVEFKRKVRYVVHVLLLLLLLLLLFVLGGGGVLVVLTSVVRHL